MIEVTSKPLDEERAERQAPVRLSYQAGQVLVMPADQDVFLISAEKATEACREVMRKEDRIYRFKREILVPLYDWCAARADRVSACYLPTVTASIKVFVVTTSRRFDFDLAEEMAKLELSLAQSGWRIGILQLPASDTDSLAAFFRLEGALQIYAQRGPAPQES